tara:strand:- start:995 stop:1609 length:615 start_codon:yes stop_codon:yes gene_type:complete
MIRLNYMPEDLDKLKELAKQAIEIRKKIRLETEKLSKIKEQFIEHSKNKIYPFTIKVEEGSIRAKENHRLKIFKVRKRDFDKLDNETKRKLYKGGLLGIKVFLKSNDYEEAFKKNMVPKTLSDLVYSIDRKPYSLSVYLDKEDKNKMIAIEDEIYDDLDIEDYEDEYHQDLYLNISPPDYQNFTDNDPADLSEIEKQDLGVEDK